ncbi:unnamed protein product [Agarophyton chilense]|eukprot:gb/GEZJ01003293.1/.p1 GENE.gb/GEZJ01003293.1/~~gb/GEZJ01003293.1/.p1  ORF type:complete len:394 (-),score=29.88 gb/GEZJ01003293.1/:361-1542(-)
MHAAMHAATLKGVVLALLSAASLFAAARAHQAIAYPWPISNDGACRVGKFKHCPGPCPTDHLRGDQTPDSPSVTVRRGRSLYVNIKRNNHAGGFVRWTLVHVRDMHNKRKHEQGAFYYTCGDQRMSLCTALNRRRDCTYDRRGKYYRHRVPVPPVYADGMYVLGYAWYGGTLENGLRGDFGDYYDCMYVQVKGGPYKQSYQPTFDMGKSYTGKNGLCKARTNWLGDCSKEPCTHRSKAKYVLPWQFASGRKPNKIFNTAFKKPYRSTSAGKHAPKLSGVSLRVAKHPGQVLATSRWGSVANVMVRKRSSITATCDVSGAVAHVIFYRNGVRVKKVAKGPYAIAGAYYIKHKGRFVLRLHPWKVALGPDFYSLSCVVHGKDGSVQYATMNVQQS